MEQEGKKPVDSERGAPKDESYTVDITLNALCNSTAQQSGSCFPLNAHTPHMLATYLHNREKYFLCSIANMI